jgi:hypothetical protein
VAWNAWRLQHAQRASDHDFAPKFGPQERREQTREEQIRQAQVITISNGGTIVSPG